MNRSHLTHHLVSLLAILPLLAVTLSWGIAEPEIFNPWAGTLEFWKIMLPAAFASVVVTVNSVVGIARSTNNRIEPGPRKATAGL